MSRWQGLDNHENTSLVASRNKDPPLILATLFLIFYKEEKEKEEEKETKDGKDK